MSRINETDVHYTTETYGFTEELTEDNFYIPAEADYVEFEGEEVEDWDITQAKPGLWENIRKKKEREGKNYKPAKKGDPDRPDPESWKKAQSKPTEKQKKALDKNKDGKIDKEDFEALRKGKSDEAEAAYQYTDPKTGEMFTYKRKGAYKKDGRTLRYVGKAAKYQGKTVKLGKPFRTPSGPKKMSVYVKNEKGNVVKVNFGDPNMKNKKSDPGRRKNFRARHNCDNPGPRWKARYWSCRAW